MYLISIQIATVTSFPLLLSKVSEILNPKSKILFWLDIIQMIGQNYSPLIISHRGYSGLLPQNTLQSIQAALHKSHLIQFDILLTKDDQIIVFHDRYLSQITNVAEVVQFQGRKAEFVNDAQKGESKNDWWVKDFTLEELKKLKIKQKSSKRPIYRHQNFKISTLSEVIKEILYIKENHLNQNTAGFLVEIKCQQERASNQRDKIFAEKIIECFNHQGLTSEQICKQKRLPICIQSFNHQILQTIAKSNLNLPIYYLLDQNLKITKEYLQSLHPKVKGVSVSVKHVFSALELFREQKKSVFFWTVIDDQPQLLPPQLPNFKAAYFLLFALKIDGIITDFPQKCQEYFNLFKAIPKPQLP